MSNETENLSQETPAEYSEARPSEDDKPKGNETSEQIRTEIEETRAELTETIDALQDKLAPAVETAKKLNEAAAPAKEKVKEKIPVVIDYVRNNPKIAAGVGVALAVIGFVIKRRRASSSYWV
jgi:ElaB/YqjD/DUF883 family membrane-anchored ribosome-binding protein